MSVKDIFSKRAAFSFEVFPPKTDVGMEKLCGENGVLDKLYTLNPDYISCTYGAGGSNVGKNLEVLDKIKKDGKCTPVTHFTCIGNTKEGIREQLQNYLDHGIDHMLALRGDLPFGWEGTGGDLHYATELVKFVRQEFGDKFTIAVAGSPEGHIACRSLEADIAFLKQKQDNGADYIMTQLCWDMDQFRYWLDAIRAAGITMPVDVGIMPILDQAATINMALSRNGCVMPRALCEIISKNWIFPNPFVKDPFDADVEGKKASFKAAGIEYTINQIDEYRACGVDGIHLYALNKGGVGKTTTCGMLIDYLCKAGKGPLLVVDADANSNLNEVLGVEVETTLGDIREEMAQAEKNGTVPPSMTKADYAEMKFSSALVEEDDYDMLVMGRTQGKGCYCFVNGVLKTQIDKYVGNYKYMVIDNEAGLEHISRGTLPHVDTMLLISDCSRRGIQAAGRLAEMIRELELKPGTMKLIVNRAPNGELNPGVAEEIEKYHLELAGVLPQDEAVYAYDCEGKPSSQVPDSSPVKQALTGIIKELKL